LAIGLGAAVAVRGDRKLRRAGMLHRIPLMDSPTVFLLSPAHCGGKRAAALLKGEPRFELAARLQGAAGAPLGEVFSFVSGLYFRGKLTYARAFARPPPWAEAALVITSGRGLLSPDERIGAADLLAFATVPVDLADPRYTSPLAADVQRLARAAGPEVRFVLLGSIATSKYIELLLSLLGDRLCFPEAFVGVGDMARGAILLRAARDGVELHYSPAAGAVRSRAAARPPRIR
jgi:hypothetical protein